MGEGSKQVRVDNWGIFFLQRLQMFFNKTDYCDLTLQFEGNVQLKVHRLVMNACTEYFRILEQTCETNDDVLIMPADLQADVVLPIVNFMYTGMLEFHMSIFDKLYKTANLMNITVLTKLLDAQKTPIAPLPKPMNKKNVQVPHTWNLQGKKISAKTIDPDLPAPLPGRKLPVWKRKSAPSAIPHTVLPHFYPEPKRNSNVDPLASFDNTPKPTRFEWPDEEMSSLNVFDSSFDDISYTSKPLFTKEDEPRPSTSFDRIKDTPDSIKKGNCYQNSFVDIDDVKDYVKEQRIRSHMNEEDEDDDVDNDFENVKNQSSLKRKVALEIGVNKRVRFNVNEKENQKSPKINILPTGKITSDVDHTKIISEVLKKYPNLVRKNKNIRLKILAKTENVPTPVALETAVRPKKYSSIVPSPPSKLRKEKNDDGTWRCTKCSTPSEKVDFVLYYLYRKHMTDVHNEKFDSRMCKFCGHKSSKHNMLMYHQYVKHGVKPPPAYTFPKCSLCSYVALSQTLLLKHELNHIKSSLQCVECDVVFTSERLLAEHMLVTGHSGNTGRNNFDCQYCTKKFKAAILLFTHLKTQHKEEARKDGIVNIDDEVEEDDDDCDDEEEDEEDLTGDHEFNDNNEYASQLMKGEKKDKIKYYPISEAEALNNVASGIATSLGLVDVVVLDENQQYILHTDNQQAISTSESEFILPDIQDSRSYTTAQQVMTSEQTVMTQSMLHNSDIASTDELVMVLTDHDYGDGNNEIINSENANIVVLYSHPIEGQESQFLTSQGNIMLSSQAGLIELRNTNAVVTSTGSHFISSANDSNANTPIESIEMIQREINQHPDMQDVKPTVEEHINVNAETSALPTETAMVEDVRSPETITLEDDKEESVDTKTNENNQDVKPSSAEEHKEDVKEDDKQSQTNDVPVESINPALPEDEQKSTELVSELPLNPAPTDSDNIEKEGDPEQSTVAVAIELDGNKDDPPACTDNDSENRNAKILRNKETKQLNLTDSENVLPLPNVLECKEQQCSATESSVVEQSVADEETPKTDEKNEESRQGLNENVQQNVQTFAEGETAEESRQEGKENVVQQNVEAVVEDEDSEEKPSIQEKEKIETTSPVKVSDKSARIILDDWEDTDSQQSDPKPGTNVNRLIDDWDDDEDERKS
ncbi:hypothetical protein FQR65_LT08909 [Abscondita terminalis]|nr:hypothetical protein FQR65_LT08909 [Abscondita terminalis]